MRSSSCHHLQWSWTHLLPREITNVRRVQVVFGFCTAVMNMEASFWVGSTGIGDQRSSVGVWDPTLRAWNLVDRRSYEVSFEFYCSCVSVSFRFFTSCPMRWPRGTSRCVSCKLYFACLGIWNYEVSRCFEYVGGGHEG